MEGTLKGAVGLEGGDLQELIDKIDEAMMIDGNAILEMLAQTGLHIYVGQSAYVEYGSEPEP
jgi:hypothetical protein